MMNWINIRGQNFRTAISVLMILAMVVTTSVCMTSCRSGVNGEIYVLCYGDYFDTNELEEFEDQTGIAVILDTYDTAEELYTMMTNSTAAYDCICTSDYMLGKMIDEGLLQKLDFDNIPAVKNIDEVYMEKSKSFDPGNEYTVPYQAGTAGIVYNKKMVGDTVIDSWDDLWDSKFEDQIVMPDSVRDAFMIALRKNGYSLNSTSEAEIKKAAEDLEDQKSLVYRYSNDSARDLVADGSAALGVVWNGEYEYIKELNPDAEFVIPKEGSEFFIDSWAIPTKATNKEGAEAWINFMCKKKVAAENFEYLYYTCPNKAAYDLIDKKYLNNEAIFPSDATLARCQSLKSLSPEATKLYSDYWKKVKAE